MENFHYSLLKCLIFHNRTNFFIPLLHHWLLHDLVKPLTSPPRWQESEIFTSLSAARRLVEQKGHRPLLLLEDSALEDFKGVCKCTQNAYVHVALLWLTLHAGVDTSEPNAVVVGLAPDRFNYQTLNQAFRWAACFTGWMKEGKKLSHISPFIQTLMFYVIDQKLNCSIGDTNKSGPASLLFINLVLFVMFRCLAPPHLPSHPQPPGLDLLSSSTFTILHLFLHFLLFFLPWQDDHRWCAAHRRPQGALLPAGGWFGAWPRALRGWPGVCCRVSSGGGGKAWGDLLHSGWSDTLRNKGDCDLYFSTILNWFYHHLVRK